MILIVLMILQHTVRTREDQEQEWEGDPLG